MYYFKVFSFINVIYGNVGDIFTGILFVPYRKLLRNAERSAALVFYFTCIRIVLFARFTCICHLYTSLSLSSMYGASENCLKGLTNRMNARMILITLTRHPPKLFIPSLDSQSDRHSI